MRNSSDLKRELDRIDGRGYKSYKDLEGQYSFNNYILSIDHVQGDPFASPSRVRVIVNRHFNKFPGELFDEKYKTVALCDFLTRLFSKNIYKYGEKIFGSGKSGLIEISRCPQEILERTAIIRNKNFFETRFYVGFPARGRSVLARELEKIIFNIIPNIVENTFIYKNINKFNYIKFQINNSKTEIVESERSLVNDELDTELVRNYRGLIAIESDLVYWYEANMYQDFGDDLLDRNINYKIFHMHKVNVLKY